MKEQLPYWLVAASLALNAVFLRRLLWKLDRLYDCVIGNPEGPGLIDRVVAIETGLGIADRPHYPNAERRKG